MCQGVKVIVEDSLPDDIQRQSREEVFHLHTPAGLHAHTAHHSTLLGRLLCASSPHRPHTPERCSSCSTKPERMTGCTCCRHVILSITLPLEVPIGGSSHFMTIICRTASRNHIYATGSAQHRRPCPDLAGRTWCACWRLLTPCRALSPNMRTMFSMYFRCSEGTMARRRAFHTSPSAGINPVQEDSAPSDTSGSAAQWMLQDALRSKIGVACRAMSVLAQVRECLCSLCLRLEAMQARLSLAPSAV